MLYAYLLGMQFLMTRRIAGREPITDDSFQIEVTTRYLTDAVFHASAVFGKDVDRVTDVPVKRLLEPKLYVIYNSEVHK
ncbi:MAG: putative membrane-bound spermidine synthase [Verrucomicrobiales bacterium]|jgi:predicted membrane-bound spermidine synthase